MEQDIKLFKNFKETRVFRPPFQADAIYGGVLLGVRSGEVFGLLGANGAGKTTTMRAPPSFSWTRRRPPPRRPSRKKGRTRRPPRRHAHA